jgi:hypothetical protein
MGARILRLARRLGSLSVLAAGVIAGCGSRSELVVLGGAADQGGDAGPMGADAAPPDVVVGPSVDAHLDAPPRDAPEELVVVQPETGATCCLDEQNTDYPPDTNCGGTTIAWQYVPSCTIAVARIELHKNGGTVALLDSAPDGSPGATLWSGALSGDPSATVTWNGADVVPPIPLAAGHVYYLEESEGTCSIATDGVEYPYYGLSGSSTWDGPFQWHPWTSHVIGACK